MIPVPLNDKSRRLIMISILPLVLDPKTSRLETRWLRLLCTRKSPCGEDKFPAHVCKKLSEHKLLYGFAFAVMFYNHKPLTFWVFHKILKDLSKFNFRQGNSVIPTYTAFPLQGCYTSILLMCNLSLNVANFFHLNQKFSPNLRSSPREHQSLLQIAWSLSFHIKCLPPLLC